MESYRSEVSIAIVVLTDVLARYISPFQKVLVSFVLGEGGVRTNFFIQVNINVSFFFLAF